MDTRTVAARVLIAVALAGCLFAGHITAPVALASSNPTSGSITVDATDTAQHGGISITATCQAKLTIASATEVDVSITAATFKEVETSTTADGTSTRTVTTDLKVDPNSTTFKEGPNSLPDIYLSSENGSVPAGKYGLSFTLPYPLNLIGTRTTIQPNQPTQMDPATGSMICPTTAPTLDTILTGSLTNSAAIAGEQPIQWDWAGINGSPSGTISWTLTDPLLQNTPPKPSPVPSKNPLKKLLPTGGHIKLTNNGIDVGLKWKDFEISYAGDWTAAQKKAGSAPTITSPSRNTQLTVDEAPAAGTSPAATAQKAINAHGGTPGSAPGATSKPIAIGPLTGVMVTFTVKGSPDTWIVIVVGNGQHQVVTQLDIKPHTSPQELVQAGAAIGSIVLIS